MDGFMHLLMTSSLYPVFLLRMYKLHEQAFLDSFDSTIDRDIIAMYHGRTIPSIQKTPFLLASFDKTRSREKALIPAYHNIPQTPSRLGIPQT